MKPLVVYDGACGLCAGNLKWLHRLDWLEIFQDIPYQDESLKTVWPKADIQACEQAMHLVFPDGRVYRGADAFREIFLRMPATFLTGILMAIPPIPALTRRLYPVLARNRYRLGGHCPVPFPAGGKKAR